MLAIREVHLSKDERDQLELLIRSGLLDEPN